MPIAAESPARTRELVVRGRDPADAAAAPGAEAFGDVEPEAAAGPAVLRRLQAMPSCAGCRLASLLPTVSSSMQCTAKSTPAKAAPTIV
jgi:hypothetical protein